MKRRILIFTLIALAFSVTARPQIADHRDFLQKGGVVRISIEALQDTHKAGFKWVEIDVRPLSDGVPMAIHGPWHPKPKMVNKQEFIEMLGIDIIISDNPMLVREIINELY